MDQKLRGFAILALEFHREGLLWVGECRELGTATDGRSLPRVERELATLVAIQLNGLEAEGERERTFAERGIKLYTDQPPTTVMREVPVSSGETLIQSKVIPIPDRREVIRHLSGALALLSPLPGGEG